MCVDYEVDCFEVGTALLKSNDNDENYCFKAKPRTSEIVHDTDWVLVSFLNSKLTFVFIDNY